MGYYYAANPQIAPSIRDHYKPVGPNDEIPETSLGALIAIADKITTIVAMFGAGEKPTSSKDPYALRRAAIGIIRIIMEKELVININVLIATLTTKLEVAVVQEIKQFFLERLKYMLKEQNMRYDLLNINVEALDDINKVVNKIKTLQSFFATDKSVAILEIYKRAHNIVEISKNQGILLSNNLINSSLFVESEEHQLYSILIAVNDLIIIALKEEDYVKALNCLENLLEVTDNFFAKVLINTQEVALRNNRLQILASLVAMFNKIANFSVI
jgi:glycyl-tRNA synthetase beta chain